MSNETYKKSLFNEADCYLCEAREWYEVGNADLGAEYKARFDQLLNKLIKLGWDREYMGIA